EEVNKLPLALCKAEIKDKCFLVNGKKVKFYGINRHDSNPETGYAVTMEDTTQPTSLAAKNTSPGLAL
ncbi:MAG: hypothetical protein IJ965_02120, partial [Campylobacter sp.]|nr:hypothetical protein [Campylobacter sp.]